MMNSPDDQDSSTTLNEAASRFSGVDVIDEILIKPEDKMSSSEEVKVIASRVTRIEEQIGFSEGFKPVSSGNAGILGATSEVKDIAAALARIEERMSNLGEVKVIPGDQTRLQGSTLKEIASRLAQIEANTAPSEDFKLILDGMVRLEENVVDKIVSLEEKVVNCTEQMKGLEKRMLIIERTFSSQDLNQTSLRFHPEYKLKNILLSRDLFTATRLNPCVDGGYYGGVVTERPIRDEEIFKVRIDEVLEEWRDWCIGIGLIRHPTPTLSTWNSLFWRAGTWSLWSYHDQPSGYSSTLKDNSVQASDYPMDLRALTVGSTVGVVRHKNGDVHFFLNDDDKGVAFRHVTNDAHAFVDIVNYVTKISIID